jgi:hypothetical protein
VHKDLFEVASEGLLSDVNSVAPPAVFDCFIRFLGTAPARIPNAGSLLREAMAFLRLFVCGVSARRRAFCPVMLSLAAA